MPIRTNVYLRRAEREDLDTVVDWMEDPDFLHFLYGDPARSPKRIREQIVGMLGRTGGNTMPGGLYFIIDSADYGPIGLISVQQISWRNRSCSIDTYIGNKKLRAGFASAVALYRALEYVFHELNMHRVSLVVYSFNSASWRLVERSGAVRELVMREHVPRDGELHDMFGYGILRSEFDTLREEVAERFPEMLLEANKHAQEQAEAKAEAQTAENGS